MKIITQLDLFDYSEIEVLGDLERLKYVIDNVPDDKIVEKLNKIRGKGRNEYAVVAMWNSIFAMPVLGHSTVNDLRRELSRNSQLRKLLGFKDSDYSIGKCKLVPPPKAFTNMFNNLKKIEPELKKAFYELREFMTETLKDFGKDVGEDGKIIWSKALGYNKNQEEDGRRDLDADYTFKNLYYKDNKGITQIKKVKYFGYRIHLLADVNYELPIEYTVTKASFGEREQLEKHLKMLPKEMISKIETLSADKGYDSEELICKIKEYGIKPVIDICNHWKDEEETKQYKDTDIVYSYNGVVYKVDDSGEKVALKYLGYDKIRNTLRYQYKKQIISIDVEYDERIFTPIARDSDKWKKIYNKRTALERINGRLDRDLNLENNKNRGLKKTTVMIDIMMLAMMSMAKGHIINKKEENIRKLKTL